MTLTLASVNGVTQNGSPQGPFNLSPTNNPSCTSGASGTTCTFQISAPVGTDIFVATTYTSNNGTGQALGSGSVKLSVALNSTNTASLTLAGPVASVQLFGAAFLDNGNPSPAPTNTGCGEGCAILRRAAAARRHPQYAATPAPTPSPTPVPIITSTRVFVIALDAQGNQIINPTTFDIPIQIQLSLNGLTPSTVTLTATYSGLPGEPTGNASTSNDGGTVTVYAPTDVVTLELNAGALASGGPSVVANYTPQGGGPSSSTPLVFTVLAPPPAAQFGLTATPPPMGINQSATQTITVFNTGTAATSGQIVVDDYLDTYYAGLTFNNTNGTSAVWTCSFLYGYDVECLSSTAIPAGAAAPQILVSVTPTLATNTSYEDVYVSGGNAVNQNLEAYTSPVIVSGCSGTGIALCPSSISMLGLDTDYVSVNESGYSGTFSVTAPLCSGIANVSISGSTVTVTGTAAGTCSATISDTNSNTANLPIQVTTSTVTGQ